MGKSRLDDAEFDKFADEYLQSHQKVLGSSGEGPEYFAEYKIIDMASSLSARPNAILDFGTGVGHSIPYLKAHFPSSEVIGLDVSARSLEVCASRFPDQARLIQFDGESIPLSDKSVDTAIAACVFHHIPPDSHVHLLSELHRVLSPGGSLFVFEHNPFNPLTRHVVNTCEFDENAILISAGEMRRRFDAAGFEQVICNFRIFFPRFLRIFRPLERFLTAAPLGAQYFVRGIKASG